MNNGARFLDRCLDACAASSYANLEVIVIDDASTDASAAIADRSGLWFVGIAVPLHFLYFFYSGVIFVICWLTRPFRSLIRATPGHSPSVKHPLGGPR